MIRLTWLWSVVLILAFVVSPALAEEGTNPFGTLDTAQMSAAMASFIGYFQGAIAIIVGVFAAVVVVKGVKSIFGGGG